MACHEAHSGQIILARMPAFVTSAGRFAVNSPWKRITVLAVSALRRGPRTQPCGTAQKHEDHSSRQ